MAFQFASTNLVLELGILAARLHGGQSFPCHGLDGVDIQRVQMNALMMDSMDMKALGVCS